MKIAACEVCVSGTDADCPRCYGEARDDRIEDVVTFVLTLLALALILVFR